MKNEKANELPQDDNSCKKCSTISNEFNATLTTALQSISKLINAITEKTICEINDKNIGVRDGASIAYNSASEIEKIITVASLIEQKDRNR